MNASPTFLILDDDEDNRFLTRHALSKAFSNSRVFECATIDEALGLARDTRIDGIIADHHLGGSDGRTLMAELRAAKISCPVVMVTATNDPNIHRRAYDAGAARVFAGTELDFVSYFRDLFAAR